MNDNIKIVVVDLFSGAGGWTEGVENAVDKDGNKIAVVIVAINHDKLAIESHAANHPETIHYIEDVRTVNLHKLKLQVIEAKSKYPNAILALHASLECTNFSNAKGGLPKDADSRTLANSLYGYIDILQPSINYY